MDRYALLIETAALSTLICAVHRLKPRLTLAPLFLLLGLFEVFLFVAGQVPPDTTWSIQAMLVDGTPANLSYMLFMPAMLVTMVLIYVMESTKLARQTIAAVGIIYLAHGLFDFVIAHHAGHPPPGRVDLTHLAVARGELLMRVASAVAIACDFVVLIAVYQALINLTNRFKIPLFVPLFFALMAAMVCDSLVYELVYTANLTLDSMNFPDKIQAGVAFGIPMAAYLQFQLQKYPEVIRRGIVERGAFDIISTSDRVLASEAQLAEQRDQYASLQKIFGRYVSPDVVKSITSDPRRMELGGELRQVTVLFADIAGYSALSEGMGPKEVITVLNRYFREVSDEVLARQGMINEFEGDAVLAVFGAPLDVHGHADKAVECALALHKRVEHLNKKFQAEGLLDRWRTLGVDKLSVRIGIHTGEVVAGNIGSEARTKYAVIGDTVNTTSRVEGLNKKLGTSLLFTAQTYAAMANTTLKQRALAKGTHAVKGRVEHVEVFTIVAESSDRLPVPRA